MTRAEKRSVTTLADEELLALPILYRGALSSLSVARETSLDLELVTYLEGLCARAYFFVYGVRTSAGSRLAAFFARDWPAAVRGAVARDFGVARDHPDRRARRLSARRRRPRLVSTAWCRRKWRRGAISTPRPNSCASTLYHDGGSQWLTAFATYLFTHNSQVCMLSFALGFAFGVPTAMLLIYNGTMLGAMLALFALARARLRAGRLADHPRLDRNSSRSSSPARRASGSAGASSSRARRAGSTPPPPPAAAPRS